MSKKEFIKALDFHTFNIIMDNFENFRKLKYETEIISSNIIVFKFWVDYSSDDDLRDSKFYDLKRLLTYPEAFYQYFDY